MSFVVWGETETVFNSSTVTVAIFHRIFIIINHYFYSPRMPRPTGKLLLAAGVAGAVLALLPAPTRYHLLCLAVRPLVGTGGILAGEQIVDGHPYLPSFVNPPKQIAKARQYTWDEDDVILASHPKSGTHLTMLTLLLILFAGDLPPKTNLHSLTVTAEFDQAAAGGSRSYEEPKADYPTRPRLVTTHMPERHLTYSPAAKYVYVMRSPVATLASFRRMELLLLGPHLTPTLDDFVARGSMLRPGGWLDQVLEWWSVRGRSNLLIVNYEDMVTAPRASAERLATFIGKSLSPKQLDVVAGRMSLRWALEHVDPYNHKATTPFSPPDIALATKSGFIVNATAMPAW